MRKARKRTNGTVTMSEVRDAVLKIASSKGEHVLNVSLDGTTVKLVTDRIRRIPRQAGLSALSVHQLGETSDGVLRLRIVNEGVPAVPWPKPGEPQDHLTCEWCGRLFERPRQRGPIPRFCIPSHRQRAYEERKLRRAVDQALAAQDTKVRKRIAEQFRQDLMRDYPGVNWKVVDTDGPEPTGPVVRLIDHPARRPPGPG